MNRVLATFAIIAIAIIAIFWIFNSRSDDNQIEDEAITSANQESNIANWYEIIDSDSGLRLLMPRMPFQAKNHTLDKHLNSMVDYQTYIAATENGTIYSLNVTDFPPREVSHDDEFLKEYVKELLESNPDNHLKSFDVKEYNGINAVNFVLENHNAIVRGRAFFAKNRLYVLTSTSRPEDENRTEFEFFANSLKVFGQVKQKNNVKTP